MMVMDRWRELKVGTVGVEGGGGGGKGDKVRWQNGRGR